MKKKILFLFTMFFIFSLVMFPACNDPNDKNGSEIGSGEEEPGGKDDTDLNGTSIKRVVAYIRSTWGTWTAAQIQGEYLTDIVLAFTLLDADTTTLTGVNDKWNGWNKITTLKENHPHLKVNMSVGGWAEPPSDPNGVTMRFKSMAADPAKRATFAANCMDLIEKRGLDGIDIDWEYPAAADKDNYVALLQDLRTALNALSVKTGKTYKLSTCVPGNRLFTDMSQVAAAVNSIKIMAYDYAGWNSSALYHAHLYPTSSQSASTSTYTQRYLDAGVPKEKLMLGLAPYGKRWTGVPAGSNAELPGYNQNGTSTSASDIPWFTSGTTSIKNLLTTEGWTRYWDDKAKQPFLYNPTVNNGTWICYADEEQAGLIMDYAIEKELGGVFYWEWYHDQNADILKVMYDKATGK